MPRSGEGVYTKPTGTTAVANETITSAQFNTTVDDLVEDANTPRPITAGGTGAETAALARDALSVAQKMSSVTDFTAGRGIIVGGGGLLGEAAAHGVTNANDLTTGRNWNISPASGIANLPTTDLGILTVERRAAFRYVQTYATTNGVNRMWRRVYDGTTWTAWAEVYSQASILGTVSQTASVPTGALIENNHAVDPVPAGGRYVRFADGTMIARKALDLGSRVFAGSGTFNDPYRTGQETWTFPAAFSNTPQISSALGVAGATAMQQAGSIAFDMVSTTGVTGVQAYFFGNDNTILTVTANLVAVGRWFVP